jgi:hypothetical protein
MFSRSKIEPITTIFAGIGAGKTPELSQGKGESNLETGNILIVPLVSLCSTCQREKV